MFKKAAKEVFYRKLQTTIANVGKGNIKIVIVDLNAKIGSDNTGC